MPDPDTCSTCVHRINMSVYYPAPEEPMRCVMDDLIMLVNPDAPACEKYERSHLNA